MAKKLRSKTANLEATIGMRLRKRRLAIGLTQEELGEHAGVTFQQVQKYEKAQNRVAASRLYLMAEFLNVPLAYFFSEDEVDV